MVRLSWGIAGERFYEAGADRGVLYLDGESGVAWNGLTSVREAPSGGSPKPYYIDGFKYLNISEAEEFEATLEAFSSPREFGVCDGTVGISNGLFVSQQPRKSFGLSYRTRIGNDLNGLDHGYKLHLVYNALASPSERQNNSLTNSTDPSTLSWSITTAPPLISGRKPTAHYVIDSTVTPKNLMTHLEDILYGTDEAQPRMPTADELITLFQSPGPIIRRNLTPNSRATLSSIWTMSAGTSGVTTETMVVGATDGPLLPDGTRASSYARYTVTTANTGSTPYILEGTSSRVLESFLAGQTRAVAIYIRSSIAIPAAKARGWTYLDGVGAGGAIDGPSTLVPANEWVRLESLAQFVQAANNLRVSAYLGSYILTVGQTIDVTCAMFDPDNPTSVLPHMDGDIIDADGIFYEWLGVVGNSTSVARSWGE